MLETIGFIYFLLFCNILNDQIFVILLIVHINLMECLQHAASPKRKFTVHSIIWGCFSCRGSKREVLPITFPAE